MINCSKCIDILKEHRNIGTSLIGTFFIAIIPKCSFCIMAYSSAIAMCGGSDLYMEDNNLASYIPLILSALVLILIAAKPKGIKTKIALGISIIGSLLILGVHQTWIIPELYYPGNFLIFMGVWVNGSFFNLIKKIKNITIKTSA